MNNLWLTCRRMLGASRPSAIRNRVYSRVQSVVGSCACCLLGLLLAVPAPAQNAPAQPQAADKASAPYMVDVTVGYANYQAFIKPGLWYPVWVLIEARKSDIQGQISLQQPNNQLQSNLAFQVAKGSKKLYLAYYQFDPQLAPELGSEIQVGRLGRDHLAVPLRFAETDEQHILVLPEEKGGFSQIARAGLDLSPAADPNLQGPNNMAASRRRQGNTASAYGGTKVIYGDMELLPDDPIALEGLDGMLISTTRVRAITPRQWDAVRTWIQRGGRLLLAGGKNQPFIEQSVLKGAFGLTLPPPGPVPAAGVFGPPPPGRGAQATSLTLLASWPTGPWTRRVLGDASHPLLVSKSVGRGWFHLCGVALDATMMTLLEKSGNGERLWPPLLERHDLGTPLEHFAGKLEGAIGYDLQRPFGFNLVGAGWVFTFLGLYILLALPLNWIVCGRLKRREWAWPVAILLALSFAWYGYSNGLRSQSSVFQVNELTFLMQPAGSPTARAVTFSSIFSPRRYNTTLKAGAGIFPNRMETSLNIAGSYPYRQEDLYSNRPLSLRFQPPAVLLEDFFFHPWSARNLRSDFTYPLSGGVTLESPVFSPEDNTMPHGGRVVNNSPWRFKNWWISNGVEAWQATQPLEKGASLDLAQAVSMTRDIPTPAGPSPSRIRQRTPVLQNSVGQIVRDSIERNILKPAQDEMRSRQEGASRPNGNYQNPDGGYQNTDASWQSNPPPSGPIREAFFIGEAETSLSPMTDSMRLERRRGVLLYEVALPRADSAAAALPRNLHWSLSLLDPDGARRRSSNMDYPSNLTPSFDPSQTIIRAESTDLLLTPDHPLSLSGGSSLTLAFRLSDPNDSRTYHITTDYQSRQKPRQVQPGVNTQRQEAEQYAFAGCPVLVYNLRLGQWEPTRHHENGRLTLAPPADYLNPGTGALALRIGADPGSLLFRATGTPAGATLKTGEDLWGDEIRESTYYYNSGNHLTSLKITDLDVTLRGVTTSTLERREP